MSGEHGKISIIGAGRVGSASAAAISALKLGEVYLFDIVEGLAEGMAMDINQASVFFQSDCRVFGRNSLDDLTGSDVVVITAGAPRRSGMKRKDLLQENMDVLDGISERIMSHCPDALVLLVTNPVEALTWLTKEHWPGMRVFGLGCSLDTLRFRYFLAETAAVSAGSVSGIVIGTHNDNMIPLVAHATIGGARAERVLTPRQIESVVSDTRSAGARIVAKLKTRGSYYTASHCIAGIVDAIVHDTRAIFPLSMVCTGQYGYDGTCLALPACVGRNGPESVVVIELDERERSALDFCATEVRQTLHPFRAYS